MQEEHRVQANSAAMSGFWHGVYAHVCAHSEKAHPISLLACALSTLFSLADKGTKNDRVTQGDLVFFISFDLRNN